MACKLHYCILHYCITEALNKLNVNINKCIAQAYDGTSVMSGDVGGVQRKMQDLVPHAVYVHCFAHRVNLVLVNVCKNEPIARDFFILFSHYMFICRRLYPMPTFVQPKLEWITATL